LIQQVLTALCLQSYAAIVIYKIPGNFVRGSIANLHTNDTGYAQLELGYQGKKTLRNTRVFYLLLSPSEADLLH
jgi:hypothetical protein